jgi:hypothetical protein
MVSGDGGTDLAPGAGEDSVPERLNSNPGSEEPTPSSSGIKFISRT